MVILSIGIVCISSMYWQTMVEFKEVSEFFFMGFKVNIKMLMLCIPWVYFLFALIK